MNSGTKNSLFDELSLIKRGAEEFTVRPASRNDRDEAIQKMIESLPKRHLDSIVGGMGRGALAGTALGTALGLGAGATIPKLRKTNSSTGLMGAVVGGALGMHHGASRRVRKALSEQGYEPTLLGLGRGRFTESAAKKYKVKRAAVTPDEVLPPGAHKTETAGTYSPIKAPLSDRRMAGSDVASGWRNAAKAMPKAEEKFMKEVRKRFRGMPQRGAGLYGRIEYILRAAHENFSHRFGNNRLAAGIDLLRNKMPGAAHTPTAYRVGGAARLMAPHAALLAATSIPAALLLTRSKDKKNARKS